MGVQILLSLHTQNNEVYLISYCPCVSKLLLLSSTKLLSENYQSIIIQEMFHYFITHLFENSYCE